MDQKHVTNILSLILKSYQKSVIIKYSSKLIFQNQKADILSTSHTSAVCRLTHTASLSSFWLEELFGFQITFCLLYFLHSGEVKLDASEACMKYTFSQNIYFWKSNKNCNLCSSFLLYPHSGSSNIHSLWWQDPAQHLRKLKCKIIVVDQPMWDQKYGNNPVLGLFAWFGHMTLPQGNKILNVINSYLYY